MKPISELTPDLLSQIKLIAFDSDGVLIQKGTDISQNTNGFYSQQTYPLTADIITKLSQLKSRYEIVINSGRNSLYLTQIYQDILWDKVTLISEIGTFLTGGGFVVQTEPLDLYELETIKKIRTELFKLVGDSRVEGFEPKQFLTTLHCHEAVPEVPEIVKQCDPANRFYCWWNEEAYDIHSQKFNKINGLKKLMTLKNLTSNQVITVGNGINDSDLTVAGMINISTDPANLQTDDFGVDGEHLGGAKIIDLLLNLV
ncbi:MAG: HAD hydrolase family protein [Candidatus Shapirobacteria bacterium]|nr:HAD hydrolase family protein [Candidatus Shapirobacteria bacterium]